ncbi:MAG: tRNA dihydrouridine synthase DusB [Bifidobacteriaceae bacterium]|jgi:nifR3 family TIM-barrel protein|nr:tRNA dihydrouridine synthase DusB [Bifidobacteriaceae bacterium]
MAEPLWARPLRLGPVEAPLPVALAPMAGVTDLPFRTLCRSFGPGLFTTEMVTCRALLEGGERTWRRLRQAAGQRPRSAQLYGVDPEVVAAAARLVVERDLADHIDLNFGCPAPKVTRQGGGAALPWKLGHFRRIVAAAVAAAGPRPVTVKLRAGIDAEHLTYLEAGLAAEAEGAAGLTLHARTAAQHYSGRADWTLIAQLKQAVRAIPVLGNGDVFEADDAVRLVRATGCDGVVVGRGCLGRPWLFADLAAAAAGRPERLRPPLGFVAEVIRRHGALLAEYRGCEAAAARDLRGHLPWYFKGYPVGRQVRAAAGRIGSLADLAALLDRLDPDAPHPGAAAEGGRGRAGGAKAPRLPEGWLDSRELGPAQRGALAMAEAEAAGAGAGG